MLLLLNTLLANALVLLDKHPFRTRDTGCGGVRGYAQNGGDFLIRYALRGTQHKRNGILCGHISESLTNVFPFGNFWYAATIRQEIGTIVARTLKTIILPAMRGE